MAVTEVYEFVVVPADVLHMGMKRACTIARWAHSGDSPHCVPSDRSRKQAEWRSRTRGGGEGIDAL
jgi:hypothetical protein